MVKEGIQAADTFVDTPVVLFYFEHCFSWHVTLDHVKRLKF